MDALQALLEYGSVKGALNLGSALLFLAAGFLIIVATLHTLAVLGKQTLLYRKRQPVKGWNRRFYPATLLLILLLISIAFALRWFTANAHLL